MSRHQRKTVHEKKRIPPKRGKSEPSEEADSSMPVHSLITQVEIHRQGLALLPVDDEHPYIGYLLPGRDTSGLMQLLCGCGGAECCEQRQRLAEVYRERQRRSDFLPSYEELLNSFWYQVARILTVTATNDLQHIRVERGTEDASVHVYDRDGVCLLQYTGDSAEARHRLAERLGCPCDDGTVPSRFEALHQLAVQTLTAPESQMRRNGFTTRKLKTEHGFWFRFGYHIWRENGRDGVLFLPELETEQQTPSFRVVGMDWEGNELFTLFVRHNLNQQFFKAIEDRVYSSKKEMPLLAHPSYRVRLLADGRLEVQPQVHVEQPEGGVRHFDLQEMPKACFGKITKLSEIGFVRLKQPDTPELVPDVTARTILEGDDIPDFLMRHESGFDSNIWDVEEQVRNLQIQREPDELSFFAYALEREWCWLDVKYQVGNGSVDVAKLVAARQENRRFVSVDDGWIDTESENLKAVTEVFEQADVEVVEGRQRLSRMQTLKLAAATPGKLTVSGADAGYTNELNNLIALTPAEPLPELAGLVSTLRHYQETGLGWLKFLADNRFGGLLCDEMGLGKTHQLMALLAVLKQKQEIPGPHLVVCPTTVLSHWKEKIEQHASTLEVYVYHGTERNVEEALGRADVLITSYGVIRRDVHALRSTNFGVVAFDEIQHIKNKDTQGSRAARSLNAEVKFGLTGTPLENHLRELKALFDVVLPGYFGDDAAFQRRFVQPVENEDDGNKSRTLLHRLIAPFTLRRRKDTVLRELPKKIEDVRHCRLSTDQAALYRETVATRAADLRRNLQDEQQPVPYIHIFSLIDMLKQICDHPALVRKRPQEYESFGSGKWDLFTEILQECLDADEKVVVFSQYLGMLEIMQQHLTACGVESVKLTGQTRRRGEVIDRFNHDPDCRVFLGSLKAGGTGIDLVGGSVVMHYDRWWNAAREEQATDRVHRIGQTRGVQVFKFITEGTLEEKIAAIIDKKRALMNNVVTEDDPDVLKSLSRQELLDLLGDPLHD